MKRRFIIQGVMLVFLSLLCFATNKNDNYLSIPLRVLRIIDGDTIVLEIENKQQKVRLIGVDTPETVHPQKEIQYYGPEATLFLTNLLKGEQVRCHFEGKDRDGRHLAYIYREPDSLFVNTELIRQGYGRAYMKFAFSKKDFFTELEQFAQATGKGMWEFSHTYPENNKMEDTNVNKGSMQIPQNKCICWDDMEKLKGARIYANDNTFLGLINKERFNESSLAYKFGKYGSKFNSDSIFNKFGTYGSKFSDLSPFNKRTMTPPKIFQGEGFIAYLTVNTNLSPRIHPAMLKAWLEYEE